jgi:CopG family nickel-responsive transcriptional regulator
MPSRVVRLGVSLEPELLSLLDRWVEERNSPSRSDALRALIRQHLSERTLENPEADAVSVVLVLYRHTAPSVLRRLTAAQHRWGQHIRSSTHFHLEGDACLEVLVLAGKKGEIREAAEDLRGIRGIRYGDYLLATPEVAGGRTGHHHPHPSAVRVRVKARRRNSPD